MRTRSLAPFRSVGALLPTLVLLTGLATAVSPANSAPARDDGNAPARVLSPAERARLDAKLPPTDAARRSLEMSPMGARAAGLIGFTDPDRAGAISRTGLFSPTVIGSADLIVHGSGDVGTQSETSIASNSAGTVLVAGYNDARGFPAPANPDQNTLSVSGVARSIDGGISWAEVPVGPGGLGTLPTVLNGSVFGDPDVKFDPTRNKFFYTSIYVRPSDRRQGVCIESSNADASTWSGPIEVTPSFIANASGDKPFMDINPNTGRIIVTWTNFGTGSVSILSSFSDDGGATWSAAATVASSTGGLQASVPRWLPGATNATSTVLVAWSTGNLSSSGVSLRTSTDGGGSWGASIVLTSSFTSPDQILGVDRVNSFPAMATDYTTGQVYVIYQANNSQGEGDIAFQGGDGATLTFSPRKLINSNPGSDRAQFLPTVTVDQSTHRVHALWYDQDPNATGDVTELMHTWSDDAGATWSRPAPLFDRPFHFGYGNDTGQPNAGDYIQAVARGGTLHSAAASTGLISQFDEGEPGNSTLFSPDVYYDQLAQSATVASLRLGAVAMSEGCPAGVNGQLDPGETGLFTFPLQNYVGNANDAPITYTGVSATLSTGTPGVTILVPTRSYASVAPLATVANGSPFEVRLDSGFIPGTYVNLLLTVTTDQGSTQLPYLLATGTAGTPTMLLNENFESASVPNLPAGWTSNVGGGTNVAWTTTTTLPGGGAGSKMAFHTESSGSGRWIRLFSPIVTVPTPALGTQCYVTLDFDLAYSTEDELTRAILAYDGLTLRITDQTTGQTLRSVLAEAFAEQLKTGASDFFPKHLPRSTDVNYFQDMSVWAGWSHGMVHVAMKFPGAGMAGRSIQLRFEYTEDATGVCTDDGYPGPCGVAIDNVAFQYVPVTTQFVPTASSVGLGSNQNPAPQGSTVTFTATLSPPAATGTVEFFDGATSLGTAAVVSGSASLGVSSLTVGTHSITAQYSGDFCVSSSVSSPLSQEITSPTAVAPAAPAFALDGLVPNPAPGGLARIRFVLPSSAPARLEVLDVSGRQVLGREVGTLGAGPHTIELAGRPLSPGLYLIRLEQAGRHAIARAVVLR